MSNSIRILAIETTTVHGQDASLGVHRCSYRLTVTPNAVLSLSLAWDKPSWLASRRLQPIPIRYKLGTPQLRNTSEHRLENHRSDDFHDDHNFQN